MLRALGEESAPALDRSWEIAERCEVHLEKVHEPFPRFDVPAGHSAGSYFEFAARNGFEQRRPRLEAMAAAGRLKHPLPEYMERLEREILLIQQMRFAGYFLIVWDFIRFARSKGIPVGPGRGSAAGSLVGYAMGITDVDPLQYGLLFERFLNPERVSLPDIDIDFCTNRRGEVIQYVTELYGREQVAQIITFGTLGAKAALKDVGRVLDLPYGEVDRISKLVPSQPLNIKLKEAMKAEPAIAEAGSKDPKVAQMLEIAQKLEGLARNASVHAAGVVIAPEPLRNLVPLFRTAKDEIVTQYDMGWLEKLGLLKMDFLGLTTLTLIQEAITLIEKTRGTKIVPEELPLDDPGTYRLFARALTSGVFQFESSGMKDVLRRYVPERIEDLIALNALYRPGPIKGGVVDDFIDRKHGRKEVAFELPELQPLLEETYGVIIYQEQVMQIAQLVAGYSLGEADVLRRAMGKKKVEEMAHQRERFLEGAKVNGFPAKKSARLFDLMAQFAEYGFNKSHSAAYGYLAYVTGYLKANYRVEFMAALLTSETGNSEKVTRYINECRDLNIEVLPPDVNHSDLNFTPSGEAIRFGLGAVRNVGHGAVEEIVRARQAGGPFPTLFDFCERVDMSAVNRRVIESLIRAGAMDSLQGARAQLFAAAEDCIEAGQRATRDRLSGQAGLFAGLLAAQPPAPPLPAVPDWTLTEKLKGEKEMLGFFVTGHPLDEYGWKVSELATHSTASLEGLNKNDTVAICGILTGIRMRRNKEGKAWASAQLEDRLGAVEVLVFASRYEELHQELAEDRAVLVRGRALPEEGAAAKISVQEMTPLAAAGVSFPTLISIRVRVGANGSQASQLDELFRRKPGATEVRLRLEKPRDFAVLLDVPVKVQPDKEFRAEVERLCGPEALEVLAT
jgi:DNA polymerase-3 subunit alpha